ncbi:MAG: heme-binding protein, partial [bacterium]
MPFATIKRLTNKGAKEMMAAATGRAEAFGIAATVAIVDAGGHMLLLERMDGGRFHTIHSSTTKAVSAA